MLRAERRQNGNLPLDDGVGHHEVDHSVAFSDHFAVDHSIGSVDSGILACLVQAHLVGPLVDLASLVAERQNWCYVLNFVDDYG